MKLYDFLLEQVQDFYFELTKFLRSPAGYPQGYGFHVGKKSRGDFVVKDGRGSVHKSSKGDVTLYRCIFDPECLLPAAQRFTQVHDAVKVSSPSKWRYLPIEKFMDQDEPCYTIILKNKEVHFLVKHDR